MTLIRPASHNPDGSREVFHPPIGLWSMRETANEMGRIVNVIDLHVSEMKEVDDYMVGYSVMFPSHFDALKEIRNKVYANVEVMGGPEGSLRTLDGVYSVAGAGENWIAMQELPLADIPLPLFSSEEIEPYWKSGLPFGIPTTRKWMTLETSRGCPYRCNFCASCRMWPKWEAHSVKKISTYLDYLKSAHRVEEIQIVDDNVSLDVHRFLDLLAEFKKKKLLFSCSNGIFTRTLLDKDVMKALRNSGCLYLSLPFEAGNEHSAKLMNLGKKYLSFEEAFMLCAALKDAGIHTSGQFIIGYPGETENHVLETLRYANALPLDERHIHIAMALRGTPLYALCEREDYFVADPEKSTYKIPAISTPWLDKDRLFEIWKNDREEHLK